MLSLSGVLSSEVATKRYWRWNRYDKCNMYIVSRLCILVEQNVSCKDCKRWDGYLLQLGLLSRSCINASIFIFMKILTDTLDKDVQFLRNERNEKKNKQAKTQTKNKSMKSLPANIVFIGAEFLVAYYTIQTICEVQFNHFYLLRVSLGLCGLHPCFEF